MKTSKKPISQPIAEQLTLFRGASHANHSAPQENVKERKTIAIYGPKCLEQFGKFDRVGSWAKTFAALLIGQGDWYSSRCSLTWRLRATKCKRFLFLLQAKTHPTDGIEYGLLLTPTAVMTDEALEAMKARRERNGYKNGTEYGSLLSQIKYSGLLPTPTTQEIPHADAELTETGRRKPKAGTGGSHSTNLADLGLRGMLPTPQAYDSPEKNTGKRNQDGLQKRAFQMSGKTSQLNPRFVAEMMGFPPNWLELPFQNGETNQ
jgi:hypothetical protein